MNIAVDPDFATNHYFYVVYTPNSPFRTRLSRFTANALGTGTVAGSEVVLYQDPGDAGVDHHGGAIMFPNDGTILFTTGDEVATPGDAQLADQPAGEDPPDQQGRDGPARQPVQRRHRTERQLDLGARPPEPVPRVLRRADGTRLHRRRRRERLLDRRRAPRPRCGRGRTTPGRTARATARPRRTPMGSTTTRTTAAMPASWPASSTTARSSPRSYQGSFFVADYAQNWIKRLTLDANGNVTNVFNFQPR